MIYFIQSRDAGPIKIGYTTDIKRRLSALQLAHPEKIKVLACTDGTRETEAELHKKFSSARIRGEWFKCTDDLIRHITALPRFASDSKKSRRDVMPRPRVLYVWMRNGDTDTAFRSPLDPRRDYLKDGVVGGYEARFLAEAFNRIDSEDPDVWPQWWLDYIGHPDGFPGQ